MAIKLMYITNNPHIAQIAEDAGVDRIFIDMEYIGKHERQGGMDTVQCHHTFDDIKNVRNSIKKAQLLVRCNPIHEATEAYSSSKDEIDGIIKNGADIIMLPYFKKADEVEKFIRYVDKRAKTMLLFETPEARENVNEILEIDGIDEVFIGLNDMSLGYGMKFMFQLLSDGIVEELCKVFDDNRLPYGFGGLASLEGGLLPGKNVLKEHYRLGSKCAILSRSFCNANKTTDLAKIREIFDKGILEIREYEKKCELLTAEELEKNRIAVVNTVNEIIRG